MCRIGAEAAIYGLVFMSIIIKVIVNFVEWKTHVSNAVRFVNEVMKSSMSASLGFQFDEE